MKPVIGITGNWSREGDLPAMNSIRSTYVNAVAGAGGVPMMLPAVEDLSLVPQMVEICDGFIFSGGPDIDPARYGEDPHPTNGPLAPCRECFDFALIEEVIRVGKPFLGICLGCQEVNVVLGGTLIQDIACEVESEIRHSMKQSPYLNRHDVCLEAGTRLAELLGNSPTVNTNSAHHQSVRRLGRRCRVAARCDDGIIEAFELEDYPFGFGIQWHPEYLQDESAHRRLFEGLVEASREGGEAIRNNELGVMNCKL